jgi:UDP-N-acetyl-D-galactosamine dehydrogenase
VNELREYGIEFVDLSTVKNMDAVVLAVAHTEFKGLSMSDFDGFYGEGKKLLIDVKGLLNRKKYEDAGYSYWRL